MATSLPALIIKPSDYQPTKRKRTHSTLDIFTLSSPTYDTKRARIGIQELSTEDSPPRILLPLSIAPSASNSEPEEAEYSSSELGDSSEDTTSSSGSSDEYTSSDEHENVVDDRETGEYASAISRRSSLTTSSSSSSSSSSSGGDESDHDLDSEAEISPRPAIITLPASNRSKKVIPQSTLVTRLNSFLPRLAASNRQLEEEREKGVLGKRDIENLGEDGEDGRYIEMNLGLGVLEEKELDADGSSSADDGDESEVEITNPKRKKSDAMATLLGKARERKPEICVIGEM